MHRRRPPPARPRSMTTETTATPTSTSTSATQPPDRPGRRNPQRRCDRPGRCRARPDARPRRQRRPAADSCRSLAWASLPGRVDAAVRAGRWPAAASTPTATARRSSGPGASRHDDRLSHRSTSGSTASGSDDQLAMTRSHDAGRGRGLHATCHSPSSATSRSRSRMRPAGRPSTSGGAGSWPTWSPSRRSARPSSSRPPRRSTWRSPVRRPRAAAGSARRLRRRRPAG